MKNSFSLSRVVPRGRTEGQMDMMKLVLAFRCFTFALEKWISIHFEFQISLFLLILMSVNDFVFCFRHALLPV
jgi:hypothetical protein